MLGKVLRYDFTVQRKTIGFMWTISLLISAIAGVVNALNNSIEDKYYLLKIAKTLSISFAIIAIVVMVVATAISAVMYYRKNLLRDEGYLMHTLPVKASTLVLSKLISSLVFMFISVVVAYICAGIIKLDLGYGLDFVRGVNNEFKAMGVDNLPVMMILVLSTAVIGCVCELMAFYASMTIGYMWGIKNGSNRDLMSVVSYILIYLVRQVIGAVSLALMGVIIATSGKFEDAIVQINNGNGEQFFTMYMSVFGVSILISVACFVGLWIITVSRLKKNLNLE